ncbi:MAG: hypothetical protein RQ739_13610 [Desulfotignum sp.]|nr:hypothetical protein [Desulfotignum sp.]
MAPDQNRVLVIVTYNGKTFDVPFIEKYFGIEMTHALSVPDTPDIPFTPDLSTIERLRQRWQYY